MMKSYQNMIIRNSNKYVLRPLWIATHFKAGLLDLQLTFAKADSVTQHALNETNKMISSIYSDIESYKADHEAKGSATKAREVEIQKLISEKEPEIADLFSNEPELMALWPDVKKIRAEIGRMKKFDLMKKFNSIIPAK